MIQVVPLTSPVRGFGSEVTIEPDRTNRLSETSAARCQHIRAVSTARVHAVRGNSGPIALAQVRETLALLVDLATA